MLKWNPWRKKTKTKKTHQANGSIDRYKATLVAKGYTQMYGVDYHETFATIEKHNIVRVLLSPTANLEWPLL